MPQVMRERDPLREIFIQTERARDVPRKARHLHRVRQPRAIMISGAVQENLRLVFKTPERSGMNDAIAVALEVSAPLGWRFFVAASACVGAELRVRSQG